MDERGESRGESRGEKRRESREEWRERREERGEKKKVVYLEENAINVNFLVPVLIVKWGH